MPSGRRRPEIASSRVQRWQAGVPASPCLHREMTDHRKRSRDWLNRAMHFPSSFSISKISSRSMTRLVIQLAMPCSRRSPNGRRRQSVNTMWLPAWVGTNLRFSRSLKATTRVGDCARQPDSRCYLRAFRARRSSGRHRDWGSRSHPSMVLSRQIRWPQPILFL